ncbi:MAG: ComEC/Rec2 family competence protein, partial [Moraxellaceae bacterium]|nr:ComEC/Rec2 family competence protein [Moraxellaceae bacterium]
APNLIYQNIIPNNSIFLTPFFTYFLCGLLAVLLIIERKLQSRLPIDYQDEENCYRLTHTRKPIIFLQIIIIFVAVLITGLQSVQAVQTEIRTEIAQPIRVLAKIRPIGLSDSNFYPQADMGYRQLAIIDYAEPLTIKNFKKNALSANELKSIDNLKGKKILLSARFNRLAKNTQLPTGFSDNFSTLNQLQPNQATQMMLELAPIAKQDEGFIHRWLRSRHVNAQANILAFQQGFITLDNKNLTWQTKLNQWRWNVREHFLYNLGDDWQTLSAKNQQARGVALSLLTGDRALISKETKYLYQLSGISHLLAISGTHVLFLAVILTTLIIALVNRFLPFSYRYISRSQLRWWVMVIGATIYALFTGFDVPSARTVYMLIGVGLARLLTLDMSARQVLLLIGVMMAMLDPYVLWQAGFWLSFVAVMLLISYETGLNNRQFSTEELTNFQRPFQQFIPFLKLQIWIFLALLPLSLLLFGKVSLWGILVNMVAIGIYGWIIVPLNLLAGLFYLLIPSIAHFLWQFLTYFLAVLHEFLAWLVGANEPSHAWLYSKINLSMILIMLLIALPMLLPKRTISKIWAIPPSVLLLMILFNQANQLNSSDNKLSVQIIDNHKNNISSLLIHSDNDNWLVLAKYDKFKLSKRKQQQLLTGELTAKDKKLSAELRQNLFDELAKMGVSSLTGIIVQTPSLALIDTSELLKKSMPVGYLWQAGNKKLNRQNQSVLGCDNGQTWQSKDGQLSIKAVTGWQEIDDINVWGCALQIDGKQALNIRSPYNLLWSGQKLDYTTDIKTIAKNPLPSSKQIILNASNRDNKLWRLQTLLCTTENLQDSLLISHSFSNLPEKTAIINWLFIDKINQNNQQKLVDKLQDYTEQQK